MHFLGVLRELCDADTPDEKRFFWLQPSYGFDDWFSLSCFWVWGDGGRHSLRQIFLSPGLSGCLSVPPLTL